MVFRDSIYQLQFYSPPAAPIPCYCENVFAPTDLMLQGMLYDGNGVYAIKIQSYSADGLTLYADDTIYFNSFFGRTNTGQDYFQTQLKTFSPEMCEHQCYIFRVTVTQNGGAVVLFDKWTEKYCQVGCCTPAYDITGAQDDIIGPANPGTISVDRIRPTYPVNTCGTRLIRLTSTFQCVDYFDNEVYGNSATTLSGTAFPFTKVTYFTGRIVSRPREIKRDISYNCNLQRSESARPYLLEGYDFFPAWKMVEIENQLHADYIAVNDFVSDERAYQFDGGSAFAKVQGARDCDEVFKLNVILRDCFIRQIFGCSPACNTSALQTFIVPGVYQGGNFFTEGQQMVGSYSDLLDYYRSQSGITSVTDVDVSGLSCQIYKTFTVEGTGYVPTSFYFDFATQYNRVFGRTNITIDEYCAALGNQCDKPDIGAITYSDMSCDAPAIGTITYSDISPETGTITSYDPYIIDGGMTAISNYSGNVTFDIKSSAPSGGVAGETVTITNQIIGVIGGNCRPLSGRFIDNTTVVTLPTGTNFYIDTNGFIFFTGMIRLAVDSVVTVEYIGIFYNI